MAPALLKVCGLTTIADLRVAQAAGADFLGVVVDSPPSPRSLTLAQAGVLARLAPNIVIVTVCEDPKRLRAWAQQMRPRALQLHGPHAVRVARELAGATSVWVAVGLPAAGGDAEMVLATIAEAAAAGVEMVVLDSSVGGHTGGTGQQTDWALAARIVAASPLPVLLAGGIGPDNAAAALEQVRPAGLDASSRLESSPGRKAPDRVHALARIVRAANAGNAGLAGP